MFFTNNVRRTLLTAFGVFWGVFLLVLILSFANGITNGIFGSLSTVPLNTTLFFPNQTSEPYMGFRSDRTWHIDMDDIEKLKRDVDELKVVMPYISRSGLSVAYNENSNFRRVDGVSADYDNFMPINILSGRYIDEMDIFDRRKVCVIGSNVADELFLRENPIGKYIKLESMTLRVVGVMESGSNSITLMDKDENKVAIPYTLMQSAFNMGNTVSALIATANDGVSISSVEEQMMTIVKANHMISPTDVSALEASNLEEQIKMLNTLLNGLALLIWIVGTGTLLSGAVGVCNIVLVSVRERTREIGVRRAIGAKPFDILSQIMTESIFLTVISGITGLAAGVLTMFAVDKLHLLESKSDSGFSIVIVDPNLDIRTALIALAVIVVVGILAGLLPSLRALKIKAIDAIRDE